MDSSAQRPSRYSMAICGRDLPGLRRFQYTTKGKQERTQEKSQPETGCAKHQTSKRGRRETKREMRRAASGEKADAASHNDARKRGDKAGTPGGKTSVC